MNSFTPFALVLGLLIGCGTDYGDDNIASCIAFESSCDPGDAFAGIYANCTIFGDEDYAACDTQPFFDCMTDNAECVYWDLLVEDEYPAPWASDAVDTCRLALSACPDTDGFSI